MRDRLRRSIIVFMLALGSIGLLKMIEYEMYNDLINAGVTLAGFAFTWWVASNQEDANGEG